MISTVIDQSLGLEFPIFQGGMAWVADASLAAGVSNAGGLRAFFCLFFYQTKTYVNQCT